MLAAVGLAGPSAAADMAPTVFCLKEPMEGFTGRGSFPLGDFEMQARLSIERGHYRLSVWNVMPDNSQVLAFDADGTYQTNGPTRLRFIDSFDNRGRGTFVVKGPVITIEIDQVKASDQGRNIGRNYGEYALKSGRDCRWTEGPLAR